jgi:subtilisin family serine protease
MTWDLKIRGETHTLKSVEGLKAVCPTNDWKSKAKLHDYAVAFGDPLSHGQDAAPAMSGAIDGGEAVQQTPLPFNERRIFENAGWWFVASNERVAKAAELREPLENAIAAREVFVTKAGEALLPTDRATVQLPEDMTDAQVDATLKQHKLQKLDKFAFAKNMFEVRLPRGRPLQEILDELDRSGSFTCVEPNLLQAVKVRGEVPQDRNFNEQWQHRNTGADNGIIGQDMNSLAAWGITRGMGVRIAVIDTGMQINHRDLVEGIVGGGFFTTTQNGGTAFTRLNPGMNDFPQSSHGTFCMGLAGARMSPAGDQNEGGCGIAPEASLIAIACADNLLTTQATMARAVHFAVEPSAYDPQAGPNDGADVISCSLDTNEPLLTVLKQAITFANAQGRKRNGTALGVPIFWSVNNVTDTILNDPVCCLPEVIAVGRYTNRGVRDRGAFGDQLAFVAPGRGVYSTRSGNQHGEGDGTSFATALAAGVGALVLAQNPDMTVADVRTKLEQSCDPMNGNNGNNGRNILTGFGKLNAHRAVS